MARECVLVFIGAKKELNFYVAKAIIEHRIFVQNGGSDDVTYAITSDDDYVFESQNLPYIKSMCFAGILEFVLDRTRVTKIYDERTNRPGTVDLDAALAIKDWINTKYERGKCREIVAVDISNLEHEADLRGRGLDVNDLNQTLDLVVEQIDRILNPQ